MRKIAYSVICFSCLMAFTAYSAEITEVLDAAEETNPFDMDIELGFETREQKGSIVREWVQDSDNDNRADSAVLQRELDFIQRQNILSLQVEIGLFRDLELNVLLPFVLSDSRRVSYAQGVDPLNSSIWGDPTRVHQDGSRPELVPDQLFPVPSQKMHSGFGDTRFGLTWAPWNDARNDPGIDRWKPTWLIDFGVIAPTGKLDRPYEENTSDNPGGVGKGQLIFDIGTIFSRRYYYFDPYVGFNVNIPLNQVEQKENDLTSPINAGILAGGEFILYERIEKFIKVAMDFNFKVRYFSEGRTYSQLSDFLPDYVQTPDATQRPDDCVYDNGIELTPEQRLVNPKCYAHYDETNNIFIPGEFNYVEQYVSFKTQAGFTIKAAKYAKMSAGVAFTTYSDHFLTTEEVGLDKDGDSRVEPKDEDGNPPQLIEERNSHYDPRYDLVGRRLKISDTTDLTFFVVGMLTF